MAVAVKTNPDARPSAPPTSAAVLSLLGVVYVVASLVLLFKLVPDMWWTVWNSVALGGMQLARFPVVGAAFLFLFSLLLALSLVVLGNRLLGPQPPPGTRAGVFVGFSGLLVILLLTRWVSIGIERLAYADVVTPLVGAVLTGVVGGVLLLVFLHYFFQKWGQKYVVQIEEMGWFSTNAYKPSQGQRVRRGTIFGILLLVGAGVYTLLHHNTLRRGGPDWALNIPFTATIAVEETGDAEAILAGKDVPLSAKSNVQIRVPGAKELRLSAGQVVSIDTFKAKFAHALKEVHYSERTQAEFDPKVEIDPVEYVMKVNRFVHAEIETLLDRGVLKADIVRRLRVLDNEVPWADLGRLIEAVRREVVLAKNQAEAAEETAFLNLPTAVVLVDRYAMRKVYEETSKDKAIRIEDPKNSKFTVGQLVSKEEFDKAVADLSTEESKALGLLPPEGQELWPPTGPVVYAQLTLLPSIQYTVPLLLILGSIWLAWRAVNMPAFADFLIATEGEMNKVSWTTQKRLMQDTIVVLVTVFLMAVFLFVVDYGWKTILQPLGVLHIPKISQEQQKQIEHKRW